MTELNFSFLHAPLVLPLVLVLLFAVGRLRNEMMWLITCGESFVSFLIHLSIALGSMGLLGDFSLENLSPIVVSWSAVWSLEFVLKLEFTNVIFLLATSIIFCVTNLISRPALEERTGRIYSLLLLKVGVIGAFSTDSLFQFCFFVIASAAPAAFLLGFDDCEETKSAATRLLSLRWVSGFLLLFCFLAMSIDRVEWIESELALQPIRDLNLIPKEVITWLMTFALLLQMPLSPFGSYLLGMKEAKQFPVYLPILTVGHFGVFGFLQFLLPNFRLELLGFQNVLFVVGLLSLVWALFSNLINTSFRGKTIRCIQFLSAMTLIGVGCASELGLMGVLMTEFSLLMVGAALFGIVSICERMSRPCSLEKIIENRLLSFLFVIGVLSAFGLPFTYSFDGLFLIFRGLGEIIGISVFWIILSIVPFVIIAVYRMLYQVGGDIESKPNVDSRLQIREAAFCFPMLALLILFAIYPDSITKMMVSAISEVFNSAQRISGV